METASGPMLLGEAIYKPDFSSRCSPSEAEITADIYFAQQLVLICRFAWLNQIWPLNGTLLAS